MSRSVLSPEEEIFVAVYLYGDDDSPPEDVARAYRAAYSERRADHQGGWPGSNGQARAEGAKILARPMVQAAIDQRREEAAGAASVSKAACLQMLRDAYNRAKIQDNVKAQIEATKAIATLEGLNVVQHQHTHRLDDEQARKQAIQALREDPSLLDDVRREAPELLEDLRPDLPDIIDAEEVEPEETSEGEEGDSDDDDDDDNAAGPVPA